MGFSENFLWGAASAAHQIEGAYLEEGKGLGIWDTMAQEKGHVAHGENGNVACDHYHRYKQDIALMKELGLKSYRLSISWPRVLPEGTGKINQAGLAFYKSLIDEVIKAGMEPMVTLYHWNLPTALYEKGGWKNPEIADWFEEYTRVAAEALKGKVKYWMTINEPQCFVGVGMLVGAHAPFEHNSPEELLPVSKHVLLAHGRAAKALREICPGDIQIGYAPAANIVVPVNESEEEIEKARQDTYSSSSFGYAFSNVWWSDPMFFGRFSDIDQANFGDKLPQFTEEEWKLVSQPLDFYGFNVYQAGGNPMPADPYTYDRYAYQGSPRTSMDWNITPDVLYWGCRFFYERYKKPILITENGMAAYDVVSLDGKVHDPYRKDFMHRYLLALVRAVEEGYPVIGYQYWSVMDNYEWSNGYDKRFGLVYVDYQTQQRIIKDSAYCLPAPVRRMLCEERLEENSFFSAEQDIELYRHQRYLPCIWHSHDFLEVVCVIQGNCTHYIAEQTLEMQEGDICIVAPDTRHAISAFHDDSIVLNILIRISTFETVFFGTLIDNNVLSRFFNRTLYDFPNYPYLYFQTGHDQRVINFIGYAYEESRGKSQYKRQMMNNIITGMFVMLLRNHGTNVIALGLESLDKDKNLLYILKYMQEHYDTVTLQEMAVFFNYSERQIQRLVTNATGISFSANILRLKMNQAGRLLSQSDMSVTEVAENVGYTDVRNFRRIFKRYYGVTPTKYRDKR